MATPLRVPYLSIAPAMGEAGMMPYFPVVLEYQNISVAASALVDTGATLNVVPYSLGLSLGAVWREEAAVLSLAGNLASYPACPLFLNVTVGTFAQVRLAFAWAQTENVPLLFGQTNFFAEFDVCFFRARKIFEVQPKQL